MITLEIIPLSAGTLSELEGRRLLETGRLLDTRPCPYFFSFVDIKPLSRQKEGEIFRLKVFEGTVGITCSWEMLNFKRKRKTTWLNRETAVRKVGGRWYLLLKISVAKNSVHYYQIYKYIRLLTCWFTFIHHNRSLCYNPSVVVLVL